MSANSDDEVDWGAAASGVGDAFGRIYDRHNRRILRHSLRLVPTPSDADDVVAITFMEAWRRRDSVRFVNGSMLPWLLVTANNVANNLSRGSRRYRALLNKLPLDASTPDFADAFDEGDAHSALRRLSATDQQVITLCVIEGLSEQETSQVLGVPIGTVKSRLSRAKSRLRAHMPAAPSLSCSQEAPHGL
jgi:RNA polymerase sigma factor (sigma-70 family)